MALLLDRHWLTLDGEKRKSLADFSLKWLKGKSLEFYMGLRFLLAGLWPLNQLKLFLCFAEPPLILQVIVSGMAGVGKSSLVRALSACAGNSQVGPTMGLQVVSIPWGMRSLAPERTNAELLLLHIEFWDVGAIALRRFSHLKEEQEREPSVIMYVASAVDASSYSWALAEIAKKPTQQPVPGRLLVITKCDLLMQSHILWRDIDSLLQANPTLPVIGVSGANCTVEATSPAEEESIGDILDEITNQAFLSC